MVEIIRELRGLIIDLGALSGWRFALIILVFLVIIATVGVYLYSKKI